MIEITPIKIPSKELDQAFEIRREVFLIEQKVDADIEFEFEEDSHHFLAKYNNIPAGTARWRATEYGIKLERFAVKKEFRRKGVASALINAIMADLGPLKNKNLIYLHAQITAAPLYSKHGFKEVGKQFLEADIWHYKMNYNPD